MKTVIIGSDNRLGLELVAHLQGRDLPFVSISSRDVALESVKMLGHALTTHDANFVINLMSRELLQTDDTKAHHRSLQILKNLCRNCRAQNAVLIHLSDDSMFAGRKSGAYRERDVSDNATTRAKRILKSESYVQKRVPKHVVVRSGPLFAPTGQNVFTTLIGSLEAGEPLDISEDKICPTPASDLARVVVAIILQLSCGATPWGLYHYCCSDAVGSYGFAEAIVALASQYGRVRRDNVKLHSQGVLERNIVLNCHHLLGTFGIKQRPWRAALPSVVAEYYR